MLNRRHLLASSAASLLPALWPRLGHTQARKNQLTLAMALEPPVLDPTASAASAIGEVVLYNLFETLTKITPEGTAQPLLAQRWQASTDLKTYRFHLRQDVQFHNGVAFDADTVRFSLERATGADSTNKDKATWAQLRVQVIDRFTVDLHSPQPQPDLPFLLGQATAIMVEPSSAATNAQHPVGTGPYRVQQWRKGSSITLLAWPGYREAGRIRIQRATFRFIPDAAAQVAALLAGDVDVFPRVSARSVAQFQGHARFQVVVAGSRAKTIVAMNNAKAPLHDVRVRRAIAAAIDRQALITGAADGFGVPIGSHYVPGAPGYIDTTAMNAYDPARATALLAEAGIQTPLQLTMTLPPTPYARQGGEIVAAQLAQVGIQVKLVNVEWAQWLSGTYGQKQYDLSLISHVEPLDLGNYAKPDYYWGYQAPAFQALYAQLQSTTDPEVRLQLLAQAQRMLAQDCVNVFLYQPQWVTIANAQLRGLWPEMPLPVNDLSALYWQ
ncbi:MAG: ABC transporter substrate-binding protein [Comamonas sp.]|nr:ABC transporter substrate-binding protein [Comamonas sp.]